MYEFLNTDSDPAPESASLLESQEPPTNRIRAIKSPRAAVELHTILDRMLQRFSKKRADVCLTRHYAGVQYAQASGGELSNMLSFLLDCVFNGECWRGSESDNVFNRARRRLNGSEIMLEVIDAGAALPPKLLAELTALDMASPHYLPGWQLTRCRRLAEKNAGRLLVASSKRGVRFRLCLPKNSPVAAPLENSLK